MDSDFDVIIVGSGPAGLSAAVHIRKQDRTVAIVANNGRRGSAKDVICPDVKEELQLLGMARDAIHVLGRACHAISASWATPTPLVQSFFGHSYGDSLIVERQSFDTTLRQLAISAGTKLLDGAFGEAIYHGRQWHVMCRNASGAHAFTSRMLVDASGRSAFVARAVGVIPKRYDRLIGASAVIRLSSPSLLQVIAAREGWWYTIPSAADETIACLMTDADIARDLNAVTISEWVRLARQALPEQPQVWPATLRVHACETAVLPQMGEHWIAVGDAAASYDPLSGIGVLHALRSARYAAKAIAQVLSGDTRALGLYAEQERQAFATYLHHRRHHYGLARRFSSHLFWERRKKQYTSIGRYPLGHSQR
jgi:flavin-dependent dehydrogenase